MTTFSQLLRKHKFRVDDQGSLRFGHPADPEPAEPEAAKGVDIDAAARSERPPQPINMNDVVRSVVLGGRPEDWQRERQRHE